MNQTSHLLRQYILGARCFTAVFIFFFQGVDLFNAHKCEELQEAVNVGIRSVNPELVEFVRAGFLRIQPDCAAFSFTKFGAVCFGDQRNGQAKHLILMQTTGQVDTRSDVTPLVRTTNLQHHTVLFVQTGEVITLQQVVGKLSERNPLIFTVETLLNRFFVDHLVNGEVFANIAQEGQHIHIAEPVIVVRRDSRVFSTVEIEERGNLLADFVHPFLNSFFGVQLTLSSFEARVANQTRRAAYQRNRLVARLLEAFQA